MLVVELAGQENLLAMRCLHLADGRPLAHLISPVGVPEVLEVDFSTTAPGRLAAAERVVDPCPAPHQRLGRGYRHRQAARCEARHSLSRDRAADLAR